MPKRHNAKRCPFAIRQRIVNALANGDSKRAIARALRVGKVEKLEATVVKLLTTVKEQASQIQKVGAQLEFSKRASEVVLNNR